jgi:hypothetical protein
MKHSPPPWPATPHNFTEVSELPETLNTMHRCVGLGAEEKEGEQRGKGRERMRQRRIIRRWRRWKRG